MPLERRASSLRAVIAVLTSVFAVGLVFCIFSNSSDHESGLPAVLNLHANSWNGRAVRVQLPPPEDWEGNATHQRKDVFVFGHSPTPDADSVGAAIGLAELTHITPACPVSQETCYMENVRYHMDAYSPDGKDAALVELQSAYKPGDKLLTVDFHTKSQLPSWLDVKSANFVKTFDTHELNGDDAIDFPEIELQSPKTESVSSMIAWQFLKMGVPPSQYAAAMMLGGIMDDSAGLNPTSGYTKWDKIAAERMAEYAGIQDMLAFARTSFEKKSQKILTEPLVKALTMDFKTFNLTQGMLVWGTLETTSEIADKFVQRAGLADAADLVRQQHHAKWAVFSIVDVLDRTHGATRLLTGDAESRALVKKAFPQEENPQLMKKMQTPIQKQHELLMANCKCINRDQYIPLVQKALRA